jgi:hypothetical protein
LRAGAGKRWCHDVMVTFYGCVIDKYLERTPAIQHINIKRGKRKGGKTKGEGSFCLKGKKDERVEKGKKQEIEK